jgi:hypothetical protein
MKIKYLYTALAILFSITSLKAQCSLKTSRNAAGAAVQEANFEVLYKNVGNNNDGDYSLGLVQAQARLFTMESSSSLLKSWGLQVGVATGRSKAQSIVPRRLVFSFKNGAGLTLDAASYEDVEGVQMCTFDLTQQDRNTLRNPIQQVQIVDTRTQKAYTSNQHYGLYDGVLAEQGKCLD